MVAIGLVQGVLVIVLGAAIWYAYSRKRKTVSRGDLLIIAFMALEGAVVISFIPQLLVQLVDLSIYEEKIPDDYAFAFGCICLIFLLNVLWQYNELFNPTKRSELRKETEDS